MHLKKRIGLLIRANLSRLQRSQDRTEAALRRADKTEALLEQLGERLNRALARQAQLAAQQRQAEEMARQWDRRADEALRAGDEAAAREAVRHKLAYTQVAGELDASLAQQTAATESLQADLARLEARLAGVRAQTEKQPPAPTSPATTDTAQTSPVEETADNWRHCGKEWAASGLTPRSKTNWTPSKIACRPGATPHRNSSSRPR